jgi:hypothetical protein
MDMGMEQTMSNIQGIVVLGFGPQPMDFFSKASKLCGKDAVLSNDVARMAGADFAAGSASALTSLRSRLEEGSLSAQKAETPGLSIAACVWLANGRRGISSNTIFTHLTGIDALSGHPPSYPRDPSDLDRCIALLVQVPELRERFVNMMECSPEWARLVSHWDEIEKTHLDEVGLGWTKAGSATKTYALMKRVLEGTES